MVEKLDGPSSAPHRSRAPINRSRFVPSATLHFHISNFIDFNDSTHSLVAMQATGQAPDFALTIENANPATQFHWDGATGALNVPVGADLTFVVSAATAQTGVAYFPTGLVCLSPSAPKRPFRDLEIKFAEAPTLASLRVQDDDHERGSWCFQVLVQRRVDKGDGRFEYRFGLIDPKLQTN
jgi:hypothetical protein